MFRKNWFLDYILQGGLIVNRNNILNEYKLLIVGFYLIFVSRLCVGQKMAKYCDNLNLKEKHYIQHYICTLNTEYFISFSLILEKQTNTNNSRTFLILFILHLGMFSVYIGVLKMEL